MTSSAFHLSTFGDEEDEHSAPPSTSARLATAAAQLAAAQTGEHATFEGADDELSADPALLL